MKFIKGMELINFQSHRMTQINFSQGLNVISGPSDNGKSAIIRALKWVLYNEPKGTDFIRQGENMCRVSITLNDNITIVRERTKSKNMYKLISPDGEESIFEGFGNEIPREILLAHGINRFFIDSSSSDSINLAEQLEGPFLISQPGSIKAKAIGKLIGVNIIDEALKELNKDLSAIQYEDKRLSNELEEAREKLKEFDYLERNKKYIDRKEILISILKDKLNIFRKLQELQKVYIEIEKNIIELKQVVSHLKNIELASELILKALEQNKFIERLSALKSNLNYLTDEMEGEKRVINKTAEVGKAINSLVKLQDFVIRYEKLFYNSEKYNNNLKEMTNSKKVMDNLKNIGKLQENASEIYNLISKLDKLEAIRTRINGVDASLSKGEIYFNKLRHIENSELLYGSLMESFNRYHKMIDLQGQYTNISDEFNNIQREISDQNNLMKKITDDYINILKEIGKCPVCLSPIENHTMEYIIREFKGDARHE